MGVGQHTWKVMDSGWPKVKESGQASWRVEVFGDSLIKEGGEGDPLYQVDCARRWRKVYWVLP